LTPLGPDNIREGNVIKPNTALFTEHKDRIILKDKNTKFRETKQRAPKNKQAKEKVQAPEVARAMVTEQRLTNVISGLGTVTNKDIGRVLNLFKEDVITEYEGELSAAEIRALMPALRTLVLARLS